MPMPWSLDAWLFHAAPAGEQPRAAAQSPDHAATIDVPAENPAFIRSGNGRSPVRWLTAVAFGVVAIGGLVVSVSRLGTTTPAAAPQRFELNGSTLAAKAPDNSLLWSYQLSDERGAQLDASVGTFTTIDWRGKGELDAVVFVRIQETSGGFSTFIRHDLYCFSSDGTLRWKYTSDAKLTFAGREFAGPWRPRSWQALSGSQPRLAVSFIDRTWWPSFVMTFGPEGPESLMFVNAGHVESLARVKGDSGTYLLAGGVNNDYKSPALAVLDEEGPAGRSPQPEGSPFACDNCSNGKPRKYFLFPRSDINNAAGAPYSYADADSLEVSVRDLMDGGPRAIYRFSPELVPESVAMSDRYWLIHRELSEAGKLDHRPEDCPARINGVTVRMWEPDQGWKNIHVPPTFAARPSNASQ